MGRLRAGLIAGSMLTGAGAAVGFGVLAVLAEHGPLPRETAVVIPHAPTARVADTLVRAGVVPGAWRFRLAAWLTAWQGRIRAGEFVFPTHGTAQQVLYVLRFGRPVAHLLTIPEGLTAGQIGQVFARPSAVFGEIRLPPEGSALPQSYQYEWGAEVSAIIGRAQRAMTAELEVIWRGREPGLPLRSARDLLILASIVERETHIASERPLVARVFLNRLRLGMRLQSDPTVAFGESGGLGVVEGGLSRAALERPGPYNTYTEAGLPAGPICSPGDASLRAVAHPAAGSALYFVADGNGGHVFADTLPEHVRNVQRYRTLTHP